MSAFLAAEDLAALTGRKVKSKQIEVLRAMGLPFWINAVGRAVVPLSAVEGRSEPPRKKKWEMPE